MGEGKGQGCDILEEEGESRKEEKRKRDKRVRDGKRE